MVQFECGVCAEDVEEENPKQIDGDYYCKDCFTHQIVGLFDEAMKSEIAWPPHFGRALLNIDDFKNVLNSDFVERYKEKEKQYRIMPKKRRYCNRTVMRHNGSLEKCNTMRQYDKDSVHKLWTCETCCGWNCYVCTQPIAETDCKMDGSILVHRDCPGLLSAKHPGVAEDMKQGRDYQICPHEDCGTPALLKDGCNTIVCSVGACRTHFCFICGEAAHHDSDHWQAGKPCPRWNQPGAANAGHDHPPADRDDPIWIPVHVENPSHGGFGFKIQPFSAALLQVNQNRNDGVQISLQFVEAAAEVNAYACFDVEWSWPWRLEMICKFAMNYDDAEQVRQQFPHHMATLDGFAQFVRFNHDFVLAAIMLLAGSTDIRNVYQPQEQPGQRWDLRCAPYHLSKIEPGRWWQFRIKMTHLNCYMIDYLQKKKDRNPHGSVGFLPLGWYIPRAYWSFNLDLHKTGAIRDVQMLPVPHRDPESAYTIQDQELAMNVSQLWQRDFDDFNSIEFWEYVRDQTFFGVPVWQRPPEWVTQGVQNPVAISIEALLEGAIRWAEETGAARLPYWVSDYVDWLGRGHIGFDVMEDSQGNVTQVTKGDTIMYLEAALQPQQDMFSPCKRLSELLEQNQTNHLQWVRYAKSYLDEIWGGEFGGWKGIFEPTQRSKSRAV